MSHVLECPTAVVADWLAAVNAGDAERLVARSHPEIRIVGPRGVAQGAAVLRDWLARAGAQFGTTSVFARDDRVVVAQHAVWQAPATGERLGAGDVASRFLVADGRVVEVERHGTLADALAPADLTVDDWT